MGQYCFAGWRLSSSSIVVVCNAPGNNPHPWSLKLLLMIQQITFYCLQCYDADSWVLEEHSACKNWVIVSIRCYRGYLVWSVFGIGFYASITVWWRHGVVVTSLVSISEVNLRWAWLVLGWVTVSGFDSRRRHFVLVCNQPPRSTQPFTLCGTVKWVPA